MADFVRVVQDLHDDETTYLPADGRSFTAMVFQNDDGYTAGELNLMQQIIRQTVGQFGVAISQPGFSFRSPVTPGNNQISIGRSFALVDDFVVEAASTDPSNWIVVPMGPPPAQGIRTDFVYFEAHLQAVAPVGAPAADTDILTYGGLANSTLTNDIKAPEAQDRETTRRVQARWGVKVATGIDFSFNQSGFSDISIHPQGGTNGPVPGFNFVDRGLDKREYHGLWRSGKGRRTDAIALNTVDGYVYGLPMFKVTRHAGQTRIDSTDIVDLRQVTNSDILGVFNLGIDCSLIVKALPVRFFNCDGTEEQARVNPTIVDAATTPLAGALIAGQVQSVIATGTAPLTVASTTMVKNLNAEFLQNHAPGTGASNVLLLTDGADAHIDGDEIRLTARIANPLYDRVSWANVFGSLWSLRNATWNGAVFTQEDHAHSSGAIAIDTTGKDVRLLRRSRCGPW